MSCEVMYTCDHCNTRCSGEQYASIGRWDESGIIALGKTVHGCSKEHLGIALAKMFGIGINGETDELLNRKRRELTKLADANNFLIIERDNMRDRLAELEARTPANEVINAERVQYETTIELQRKRIEELEKRIAELTAPVTVDGKTPGEVLILAQHGLSERRQVSRELFEEAERCANAVLRAFGQPSQTTQTNAADALRQLRVEFVRFAADARMPGPLGTQYTINEILAITLNIIDAQLAKIEPELEERRSDHVHEPQAITLPTKPTKPLRTRLEELATYWETGAASSSMSEGYRQASKDCAKELREVINDPR